MKSIAVICALVVAVCDAQRIFDEAKEVKESETSNVHAVESATSEPGSFLKLDENDGNGSQKLILVDTDAGIDDAFAILTLLNYEKLKNNVKIVLMTTVNGNTHADQVRTNVLKILKIMNRTDIPVFQGMNDSLIKTTYSSFYYGQDGLGDFEYSEPISLDLFRKKHGVNALVDAASENPGKLSLLCLGPLTNVAMASKMDPKFLENLKEIFVLGGSDSGVGNVIPGVEFNFFMDPHAAYVVFKEIEKVQKQLTLVTWETVAERNPISMEWRKNILGEIPSSTVLLMNRLDRRYLEADRWESADLVPTLVLLDESLIKTAKEYHVDVEICGQVSQGAIFLDHQFNSTLVKNVRLIERLNIEKYKNFLLTNLIDLP